MPSPSTTLYDTAQTLGGGTSRNRATLTAPDAVDTRTEQPQVLWLFGADWSAEAAQRFTKSHQLHHAGFDLFSFPSNAKLMWFDINRFVEKNVRRFRKHGLCAVLSHEEQFGALSAALIAERLGLPGTNPDAILKLQHKLICRQIIEKVAPECNLRFSILDCELGRTPPDPGTGYPFFIKPIKASFSVLARKIDNYQQLCDLVRFRPFEKHIISRLVKPFDDVCQQRLNSPVDARTMLIEEFAQADQFNLDGYVFEGQTHLLGVIDEQMYPDTQAFQQFSYPSVLPASIQQRAFDAASKVLKEAGFDHGFFNMEFFYDKKTDAVRIVEFNPRLAAQLADLYERVDGIDVHAMSLALAMGQDPKSVPTKKSAGSVAVSRALRTFDGSMPNGVSPATQEAVASQFPDCVILYFDKTEAGRKREFKWMNSNRFGVINMHGDDRAHVQAKFQAICDSVGWSCIE